MNKVESVSFPRSGHALTVALLKAYFGPDFVYDEEWPGPGKWKGGVHFQKNHDFDLDTPILTDRWYLVQVRDPFAAIRSWHRMTTRLDGILDTREGYLHTLDEKLDYWTGFVRKWVIPEIPNRLVVKYEDLVEKPEAALSRIVRIFSEPADQIRIRRAACSVPVLRRTYNFYL